MSNIILLLVCLLIGIILKHLKSFPKDAHIGLNAFIIYISLPAITLRNIPEITITWSMFLPLMIYLIIILFSILLFKLLNLFLKLDNNTLGCMILTCGLGNTSFVGFPIVSSIYGDKGLSIALVIDQGAFLALSLVGISVAMIFSDGKIQGKIIIKRMLNFPPFIAFVIALFAMALGGLPTEIKQVLEKLGSLLTPLALVSVGLQINLNEKITNFRVLALGLLFKLFFAPLLIYLLFTHYQNENTLITSVSVIEAAMPPMITASILATQYKLNPKLANLFVSIGIPISFLTLWFWKQFLD